VVNLICLGDKLDSLLQVNVSEKKTIKQSLSDLKFQLIRMFFNIFYHHVSHNSFSLSQLTRLQFVFPA